jgi:uncharacterized protein YxjI
MGRLRSRRDEGAVGSRYQMRERLLSIGDDYWIENEDGSRAFRVDGKALRIRKTLVFEDTTGREVAKLQERKLSVRDKMEIERDGRSIATVRKALVGIRDRFSIDVDGGADMGAKGNLVDHEYEIERTAKPSRPCRSAGSPCATATGWRSPPKRTTRSSSRSRSASTPSATPGTEP